MQKLREKDANLIVAGQAIADPSCIVKELVDNSIDAGASKIDITLTNFGIDGISVSDDAQNGCTSKIESMDDLENLKTNGFRGKALFSIATLCSLEIKSQHSSENIGFSLTFDPLASKNMLKKISRPTGTTITVTQIYHNLPVRKRDFQSKKKNYLSTIVHYLQSMSMLHRSIRFNLYTQQTKDSQVDVLLNTQPNLSLYDSIVKLFSLKKSSDLLEVNQKKQLEKGEFSINGYIDLNPSQSSKNFFYLNEKLFSSPKLVKKITQAIQNITQRQNQMLFYVLFIVTSEKIDHNVSMNKMSKFINNESELFSFVTESIVESICNTKSSQVLSSKPLFTQSSFTPDQLTSSQKDADSNLTFINPNRDSIDMSMAPSTPQSKSTKSMSSYTFSPTLPSLPSNYMQHFKLSQDTNQKSKDYNNTIKVEISKCKNMSNTIETDLEALKKGSLSISALMEKFEEKDDKTTTKISMKTFENDLKNLSQRIEQSLLSKMQIVGQFNRGFIIARNGLHFYIIDQHGADERFNFDHFLSQEKYDNQKLVVYF